MSSREDWKENAAKEAAGLVEDEMTVGLGSGTTLEKVVEILGEKDSKADFVTSSTSTQRLANKYGLNTVSLEKGTELDMGLDGADEVDLEFSLMKGGGGAHTREKIVAGAAKEFFIVVDQTKLVQNIGETHPVPIEVIPFAFEYASGILENYGRKTELRMSSSGAPFVTDNGNYIIDLETGRIEDPEKLERELNMIPAVIENGIFFDMADRIFVGYEGGCEVLGSETEFQKIYDRISSTD